MAIVNVKQFDDYILQAWNVYSSSTWYNSSYIDVNAIDTVTGEFNTQLITTAQGSGTYAASICENATDGGYNDWYLPSTEELVAYFNAGYTTATVAWSSTEVDVNDAYIVDLDSGDVLTLDKELLALVVKFRKEYTTDVITIERMNLTSINAPILSGGVNNADEDVYKMLGGINGISKNSKIMTNE